MTPDLRADLPASAAIRGCVSLQVSYLSDRDHGGDRLAARPKRRDRLWRSTEGAVEKAVGSAQNVVGKAQDKIGDGLKR